MDSFEHDGVWWDPDTPDRQLVGTLRFDAATGATLTVTAPADHANPFRQLRELPADRRGHHGRARRDVD